MLVIICAVFLAAVIAACADRNRRKAKAAREFTDAVERVPSFVEGRYADYSHFNEDQLLRNRSERWD